MPTALRLLAALGAAAAIAATAQLALVNGAQAQTAGGQALPPPPYATSPAYGTAQAYAAPPPPARGGEVQAYDRYGAGRRDALPQPAAYGQQAYGQASYGAPASAGPRLSWGGKVEAAPPAPAPAYAYAYTRPGPYPSMAPAVASAPAPAPVAAPARADAAPRGWTFVPPIGAPPPSTPTSIYDAPPPPAQAATQNPPAAPPAPAAQAQASADGAPTGPRRYSVHRDYGMEPDPVPLPPQFFGATADLSQPATPDPIRRTTTANGKTQNPIQPEGGQ